MSGRDLYEIQLNVAQAFGETLPMWEQLSPNERIAWEERAFEQEARDRHARRLV